METEFIYWRHKTPVGIKVEEVCGSEQRSGHLWRQMAEQVYQENGKDGYREVDHYPNGAPYLVGDNSRISLSHTDHLLVVATLPKTPEADLSKFSLRTAMGIDTERADREQVIRVREKFLNDDELARIPADDLLRNIVAWTCKEALYKAALTEGLDYRNAICIEKLPAIEPMEIGEAVIMMPSGEKVDMHLYSYLSEECVVTIAFSPKCAKFTKGMKQ